ncbi:hypothetical protein I4U23_000110 [Adineta vaga]|nr:hypothetical protein I4U23_000110 [Adineta vaga]
MGCCCSKSEVAPSRSDEKYLVVNQPKKVETNDRYNKIGISTIDPSLLIKGYENESVSSLEEALQPFHGKISHLNEQIQEAKSKCHYPSEHNLTHDESAALYLYLNQDKGDTVYNNLQQSWNTNNRTQMEPWFKYLKLLKNALNKLPDVKSEVYQGISYDKSIENILRTKNTSLYTCMGLSSPSIEELKKNLQNKSDSKMLLVGYRSVDGKDVTGYGPSNQKETFIWPGIKLTQGKQNELDKSGSITFHLTGKKKIQIEVKKKKKKKFPKKFISYVQQMIVKMLVVVIMLKDIVMVLKDFYINVHIIVVQLIDVLFVKKILLIYVNVKDVINDFVIIVLINL